MSVSKTFSRMPANIFTPASCTPKTNRPETRKAPKRDRKAASGWLSVSWQSSFPAQEERSQHENQSVTGIAEAEPEKYHIERSEKSGQVHRSVFRKRIELSDDLERIDEPVVFQNDGSIVLRRRLLP